VWDKVYEKVKDKVNMQLEFIGKIDPDARYGVTCMHGESECLGNIHELCFIRQFPQDLWWHAVQCMNYAGRQSIGTEKLAIQCAKVIKKDYEADGVKECVEGPVGAALLRESVRWSQHLGIKNSCSILINGKIICVKDGVWKQCEGGHEVSDFVRQVETTFEELNA